jgi:hypothetical protein
MRRGLIILVGECFRDGCSTSRIRDTEQSLVTQKEATESHLHLVEQIRNKYDINTDIIISTYTTKFEAELKCWYGESLVECRTQDDLIGMEKLLNNTVKTIDRTKYDFVFGLRIDVILKPRFYEVFNPTWTRLTFSNICWIDCARVTNDEPRIADTMIFIPKRLYWLFDRYVYLWHDSWINYKYNYGLTNNDLNFMIDTYHDSNPAMDWNPLYKFAGREEVSTWRSEGHVLNMETFKGQY